MESRPGYPARFFVASTIFLASRIPLCHHDRLSIEPVPTIHRLFPFERQLLDSFQIPVRNESTGEIRLVGVARSHETDAQIEALQTLFKQEGWRKATALRAVEPDARLETP